MKLQGLCGTSPQLHPKLFYQRISDLLMVPISFLVSQSPLQTPVVDAVAKAFPAGLRMRKLINHSNIFSHIPADISDDLHDIVFMEILRIGARSTARGRRRRAEPERYILVASRVL